MVGRVAVIGAGPSGLTAIKSCLEEGLEPTCYERDEQLGGVWVYREESRPDRQGSALYESLISNTSKVMSCFSDYPFLAEVTPYFTHQEMLQYIQGYAKKFDLERYIEYKTEVLQVTRAPCFEETGRWVVKTRRHNGEEKSVSYDAVLICSGYFSEAVVPVYSGQDTFEGEIIHSNQYRKAEQFTGKNILVVGASISAGDIANDASHKAKQVYMSMRNGTWIFSRFGPNGWPADFQFSLKYYDFIPANILEKIMTNNLEKRVNLSLLGIKSEKPFFQSLFIANDGLPVKILCGKVKVYPGIDHFTKRGVVLTDGQKLCDIDAVVYATGYKMKVPFIDESIVQNDMDDLELFMQMFPPKLKHPTLACIGYLQPLGAGFPVFEMQCRWATRVFKGLCTLPTETQMLQGITDTKNASHRTYGKVTPLIYTIPYKNMIAQQIGCMPNLSTLFLKDPKLAFHVLCSPVVPAYHRLVGPHTWEGARDIILDCWNASVIPSRIHTTSPDQGKHAKN